MINVKLVFKVILLILMSSVFILSNESEIIRNPAHWTYIKKLFTPNYSTATNANEKIINESIESINRQFESAIKLEDHVKANNIINILIFINVFGIKNNSNYQDFYNAINNWDIQNILIKINFEISKQEGETILTNSNIIRPTINLLESKLEKLKNAKEIIKAQEALSNAIFSLTKFKKEKAEFLEKNLSNIQNHLNNKEQRSLILQMIYDKKWDDLISFPKKFYKEKTKND